MKHFFISITFLCISTSVWSQIETKQSNAINIPAIESEEGEATETNNLDIKPFEAPAEEELNTSNKVNGLTVYKRPNLNTEEGFSMFDKKKYANPAELYKNNLDKQLQMPESEAVNPNAVGSLVDQYFGDFETKSGVVNIIYRDYQAFDGDRVIIYLNDDIIKSNVLLTTSFKGLSLVLQPGLNKIEFQALNTGTSGPNTAEFRISDDDGNFITGNTWNLAKGVKGSIIIVKK